MLKLVPFNDAWINHDRIDIHAIYRRPRFVEDEYGEKQREYDKDGLPTWDLTGPLPVKKHNTWRAKGFEYITLANRDSLNIAARTGTLIGGSVRDYDQHQTGGPWNYRKYVQGQTSAHSDVVDQLKADVAKYGWEAVEAIRRQIDPAFTVPAHLKTPTQKVKSQEPKGAAA